MMEKEKSKTRVRRKPTRKPDSESEAVPTAREAPAELPMATERGFFRADDGTALYYEVRGEGKPLVLCYGLTCRREHWRHQVAHFSKTHRVITFDYRGHHSSDRPMNDRNLTIEWCGRDVLALLRHLGVEGAVCFGHSMGVPVVVEAIRREPKAIQAAVFICGGVTNPFSHMLFTDRLDSVYRAYSLLYEWAPDWLSGVWKKLSAKNAVSYFLASRFGFNPTIAQEEDILGYLKGVEETALQVFYTLIDDYSRYDGRGKLKEIEHPVLVVAGSHDCITPVRVQREVAELLPNSSLIEIPYGSHNAHTDFPEKVNREIETFLKKLGHR